MKNIFSENITLVRGGLKFDFAVSIQTKIVRVVPEVLDWTKNNCYSLKKDTIVESSKILFFKLISFKVKLRWSRVASLKFDDADLFNIFLTATNRQLY